MQSDSQSIYLPQVSSRDGNLRCPHCFMPSHRRTSEEINITTRSLLFSCTNAFCTHSFRALLVYDYGIAPSAIPNPDMAHLPMRTPTRSDVMAAVREARLGAEGDEISLNQLDLFATFSTTADADQN